MHRRGSYLQEILKYIYVLSAATYYKLIYNNYIFKIHLCKLHSHRIIYICDKQKYIV